MYCKQCGKPIEGERDVCDDCLSKQSELTKFANSTFKKALSSTILGAISFFTLIIAFVFMFFVFSAYIPDLSIITINGHPVQISTYYIPVFRIISLISFFITIPLAIISMVFGIKGILAYCKVRKITPRKHISWLVLSIIGIALALLTIMYLIVYFVMLMLLSSLI